jgi:hypothetical protein
MRHFLLAAAAAALLPFHHGFAQEANQNEMQAVTEIAQCLLEGLPDNWASAHMIVELARPGEATGGVRYLVARKDAEDKLEPFTPCDNDLPAAILVGLRGVQPGDRRGWTSARLVVTRDGNFKLNYDFPK